MTNRQGSIPKYIEGYGKVACYGEAVPKRTMAHKRSVTEKQSKDKISTLKEAICQSNLQDGMTVSFHHHLRNGDYVMKRVLDTIHELGIKDLTVSASSISKIHDSLLEYLQDGTITRIYTAGLRSQLAHEVQHHFNLKAPIVFMTHGGRARAIEDGSLNIDIAFVAASCSDYHGNMCGTRGPSAFGSMGYPMVDVAYAKRSIAITDNLIEDMTEAYPDEISISGDYVDYVVEVERIGDPEQIATGSTRITSNPMDLLIARKTAHALIASGAIRQGFSFQAGSGGISLAVCKFLENHMKQNQIVGAFASGGVTGNLVELFEKGLFEKLYDVQTFGQDAIDSLRDHAGHIEMSADTYANPNNPKCVVNQLDVMILSATEIDVDFNINSITGSNGVIMGALGGAPDTAAGAKMAVVVAPSMRTRIPIVVDKVTTICTPGTDIDMLVTERGICVNPKREDIKRSLIDAGIEVISIHELKDNIQKLTGVPDKPTLGDKIVAVVEYRDGSVIDVIYNL